MENNKLLSFKSDRLGNFCRRACHEGKKAEEEK